jgi:hypothetical protein
MSSEPELELRRWRKKVLEVAYENQATDFEID